MLRGNMTKPINILYVDDYPLDHELVRDVLEKEDGGFKVIEAASRAELEARLMEGGYDLVLSDFNILGFEGLQVLEAVQAKSGYLPVVILTGTGSEEIAVEAMKRGAADYVVKKPDHLRRLPLTLRAVLERVRAEEALRDSERRLTEAQRIAHIGYWECDFEAGRITLSEEACRIFGLPPQEVSLTLEQWRRRWLELIHPADQPRTAQAAAAALQDGPPYKVEYRVVRPNGEVRFIHSEATLNRDEAGRPCSMLGMMQDITERKLVEEALRQSEWKYREIFDNVLDALYLLEVTEDGRFRTIEVNPALERLTGIPRSFSVGKTQEEIVPPEVAAVVNAKYRHCVETGQPIEKEVELDLPAGRRYFQSTLIPARDETGKIHRLIGISHDITERRKAEMQILASEQLFRALVENSPDFIVRLDRDYRHTYVNPAVEKAFAMPAEAFIGKTLQELPQLYKPERFDALLALLRRTFEEGVANNSEIFWDTQMGQRIFEIRHVPEKDATGNVISVLSIAHDITERKLAEQERLAHLRFMESMDRINRAIQGTNDLEQMMRDVLDVVLSIFECDRAWLIYPCDPETATWQPLMERTRPDYPGVLPVGIKMPLDPMGATVFRILRDADGPVIFGPGSPHQVPEALAQIFRVQSFIAMAFYPKIGQPWSFGLHQCSYPRVWTSEEERLFQEIGRRLADALTGLLVYRDLQESELRYREVFDNVSDSLFVFDITAEGNFHFIGINAAAERLSGVSSTDVYGKLLEEVVRPEVVAYSLPNFRRCLERGAPLRYEEEYNSRPLGRRYLDTTLIPVRNNTGAISRLIAFNRDITERKRAEEEIRQFNQELEQRVLDRTAQLEAANKELEAFAYSVSHDLRAPLRHINGFLELLQPRLAGMLDERSQHYMTIISDSAKRMGQLIDDLLTFSRMGRSEMSKRPVDLGVLVQEVIWEFDPETQDRSIQWRIAELPLITGDWAMLRLVLVNLIANALKFTRERQQAEIEIGCLVGNNENIIFVRDNGVGFDMAYADKLFGVFQRLHRADEIEGTGIGLANVRRIIQRHGGRTWAEGKTDHGATFYFSLPLNLATTSVTPQTADSARAQAN